MREVEGRVEGAAQLGFLTALDEVLGLDARAADRTYDYLLILLIVLDFLIRLPADIAGPNPPDRLRLTRQRAVVDTLVTAAHCIINQCLSLLLTLEVCYRCCAHFYTSGCFWES